MRNRLPRVIALAIGLIAMHLLAPLAAQAPPAAIAKKWTVPRTADGKPDLQGNWSNETQTPIERLGKQGTTLSKEEAAAIEERAKFLLFVLQPAQSLGAVFIKRAVAAGRRRGTAAPRPPAAPWRTLPTCLLARVGPSSPASHASTPDHIEQRGQADRPPEHEAQDHDGDRRSLANPRRVPAEGCTPVLATPPLPVPALSRPAPRVATCLAAVRRMLGWYRTSLASGRRRCGRAG